MLELRAVHLVCQAFLPLHRSCHIQFFSDNIAAVVYIKKQGSTKSPSLCSESIHLWNWCIRPVDWGYTWNLWNWCIKRHVTFQHDLPFNQNSLADVLSRTLYLSNDWELHDGTF